MYKFKKFKTESEARAFMVGRINASLVFLNVANIGGYAFKVEYKTKA